MTVPTFKDRVHDDHAGRTSRIVPGPVSPTRFMSSTIPNLPPITNDAPPVAIAVDPVALITTECITVTSAMRKHARWSHSSVSAILGGSSPGGASLKGLKAGAPSRRQPNGSPASDILTIHDEESLTGRWGLRGKKGKSLQDSPLMSAFARLRNDLRGCTGMQLGA